MSSPKELNLLGELERRLQAAVLHALALTPHDRLAVVEAVYTRRHRDSVSYWLQLLLSMAIATVGLVLDSTAVVIGAMLIAPLMGPILELGMALVLGSPVLTIRSLGRVGGSIAAVIAGAALLTVLLPYHEINGEIASRTSPTVLDLLLGIFVALAAAFTAVRSSSETTSAAAGTAIGIALVPPLCVIGFGIGIGDPAVTGGATLLFVANLAAILLISVAFFWLLGFELVETEEWERNALATAPPHGTLQGAVRVLRSLFGSRYGRVMRIALPLLLVGSVVIPLTRALDQVAWEVRARSTVSGLIDRALGERSAVQTQVAVSRRTVAVSLYLVGSVEDAGTLEGRLRAEIAAATGVIPAVRVVAVPDLASIRATTLNTERAPELAPGVQVAAVHQQLGSALRSAWPADALGPLLSWYVAAPDTAAVRLVVRHLGPPAGPAVETLLSRNLSRQIGGSVQVRTRAYPAEPLSAPLPGARDWLPGLASAAAAVREVEGLTACVEIPPTELLRSAALRAVADRVHRELADLPPGRAELRTDSASWSVRLSAGTCAPPVAAPPAPPAATRP